MLFSDTDSSVFKNMSKILKNSKLRMTGKFILDKPIAVVIDD
jgi:hypothetical protein